jgi:two-component system response regulator AtoC
LRESALHVAVASRIGADSMVRIDMKLGQQTLADIERAIIDEVLQLANYNKTVAAKQLGLTRFSLDRRLKKIADG